MKGISAVALTKQ